MRNFIFVFILLATVFMVNAVPHQLSKRDTHFSDCPIKNATTLSASIVPDPIVAGKTVAFSVFGTLNHDVTAGTTFLAVEFADATGKTILTDVYFQVFETSYKAGDTVSITASSVHTPQTLPSVYTIGVGIGDPLNNPVTPLVIYGCTFAVVGSSASSQGYPFGGFAKS